VIDEPIRRVDEGVLHAPVPRVLAGLVRRVQREEQHPGRYQIDAALHDDAAGAEETDWPQILAWHDDLVARWHAVRGHLHELGGDLPAAGAAYAEAAHRATDVAERDHLVRQAARARAGERGMSSRLIERPS
jgi:predicted RNA polymerase sigma factor